MGQAPTVRAADGVSPRGQSALLNLGISLLSCLILGRII